MPNLSRKNISELLPDEPIKDTFEDEINFNNTVREYVLFAFILVLLTITSDAIVRRYKRKEVTSSGIFYPAIDDGEAIVDRVALWLCTFSLSVSLGAVLLLPFSIVSSEVLTFYRDSDYVRWISLSLVQGLWNMIFLFSNMSLFVGLPFAYLFTESEGFPGSSKGLKARVIETVVVLCLLVVLVFGVSFVISFLLGYYKEESIAQIIETRSMGISLQNAHILLYGLLPCLQQQRDNHGIASLTALRERPVAVASFDRGQAGTSEASLVVDELTKIEKGFHVARHAELRTRINSHHCHPFMSHFPNVWG